MQIKLSKTQWEEAGKQKGWLKKEAIAIAEPVVEALEKKDPFRTEDRPCKFCGDKAMVSSPYCHRCYNWELAISIYTETFEKIITDVKQRKASGEA